MTERRVALCIEGGWEGHKPAACLDVLVPILEAHGYDIRRTGDLESLRGPHCYASVELIVPALSMTTLPPEAEQSLVSAVERGAGLVAWHGAATLRDNPLFALMLGGTFVDHPGGTVDYTVSHVANHPLTEGLGDIRVHAEQYAMHVDPGNTVLATTTFGADHLPPLAGTIMPVAWTRRWGAGRVVYTSLGHGPEDLAVPEVRTLLERAVAWRWSEGRR